MKTKRKFYFGFTLVFLIGMLITWNSCTKQDDVVKNDSFYNLQSTIRKGLNEAESKLPFNKNDLEIREFESSCLDSSTLHCDNFAYVGELIDFTIPFNDSCNMKITVKVYKCTNDNNGIFLVNYIFDSFDAYPIKGECDYLLDYWKELEENGELDKLAQEKDKFYKKASEISEKYIMDLFVKLNGTQFSCNSFHTALQADFYKNNCYRYYGVLTKGDRGGLLSRGGGFDFEEPEQYIPRYKCGDACCLRQTLYCVKNDGTVHQSDPVYTQIGECDPSQAEIPDIPGFYPYGDCFHDCE